MGKVKESKGSKAPKANVKSSLKNGVAKAAPKVKESPKKALPSKKVAKKEETSESEADSDSSASGADEDSHTSASSSAADSDSDSEAEKKKPTKVVTKVVAKAPATKIAAKVNGKAVKKAAETSDSSDSSGSSDEDDSDSEEAKPAAAKEATSDSDDSDDSDESGSDEAKLADAQLKENALTSDSNDSDDSASDSDDSDSGDSDSSDSESSEKAEAPSKKRKAEDDTGASAKRNKSEGGAEESATLFVGNLSWKVDDAMLFGEFEDSTGCTNARIITNKDDGRPRGFGYVDFDTAENAKAAMEAKNGDYLDGRDMRIDLSGSKPKNDFKDRANNRSKQFNDQLSPESDTLWVGNMSFNVDEESVSAFFNEVASVKSLRLPTEQETGRFKGFGYITFHSIEDAKSVVEECQGADLMGRPIRLDYASARPDNGGGGGGGFGGRGRGGFGDRGGRGGGRGRGGFGDRGGRGGGRGRGGFGDRGGRGGSRGGFQGKKTTF